MQASLDKQHGKVAETEGALAAEEAATGDKVRCLPDLLGLYALCCAKKGNSNGEPGYGGLVRGFGRCLEVAQGFHLGHTGGCLSQRFLYSEATRATRSL